MDDLGKSTEILFWELRDVINCSLVSGLETEKENTTGEVREFDWEKPKKGFAEGSLCAKVCRVVDLPCVTPSTLVRDKMSPPLTPSLLGPIRRQFTVSGFRLGPTGISGYRTPEEPFVKNCLLTIYLVKNLSVL